MEVTSRTSANSSLTSPAKSAFRKTKSPRSKWPSTKRARTFSNTPTTATRNGIGNIATQKSGSTSAQKNDRLIIEISDHGQRFDFSDYRPDDLQKRIKDMKPGGYGIHIMRKFMDEVQYNSSDEAGNTLRLVKYLKKS